MSYAYPGSEPELVGPWKPQVRVLVDSAAGLPADVCEELEIQVEELHVLDSEEGHSTAGLSSLELAAAYARQLERGGDRGLVALHLSKELSATWSAAVTASGVFDGKVSVVDTEAVGMAVGAAAMAAAKLAADGADLETCTEIAVDTLKRAHTWVYLHRIEDIRRSGRISTATALLSTTLATKPIMKLTGGKVELAAKTRTQTKAFSRLAELAAENAEGQPVFVAIQHHDAEESAQRLHDILCEALHEDSSFMIVPMTKVLAVHCGEGAVGLSMVSSQVVDGDES